MGIYLTSVVLIVQMDVVLVLVAAYHSATPALLILAMCRIISSTELQHAHLNA